jgi:organic radical activating enzyme
MVELTIEITNQCDELCNFCSSDAKPSGKHLSFEKIKEFLSKYKNIERINISGGEPLSHPQFYRILKYCKMLTENVWVYTNAIPNIAYNTHVIKEINVMANVCIVPGRKVYIPKGCFSTHILEFVPQGRGKNIQTVPITVSGNLAGGERCITCNQPTLMANGKVVTSPCRKSNVEKK